MYLPSVHCIVQQGKSRKKNNNGNSFTKILVVLIVFEEDTKKIILNQMNTFTNIADFIGRDWTTDCGGKAEGLKYEKM